MDFIFKSTTGDSYAEKARACGIDVFEEDIDGEKFCLIKINTIAQLEKLSKAIPSTLIIDNPNRFDHGEFEEICVLEVYDDYRE